jgi:K+-sensing histidine kinase KdpD
LQRRIIRYGLAAGLTLILLGIYSLWFPGDAHSKPYLFSLFPIVICAIVIGYRPGVLSLVITSFYIDYYLTGSVRNLQIEYEDARSLLLFIIQAFIVLWLIRQARQAQSKLATANGRLEESLSARDHELGELKDAHDQLADSQQQLNLTADQLRDSNKRITAMLEHILDDSADRRRKDY